MAELKGFLLVTMEPPAELEEEFNDWYDMEHIPGRGGIPGFETARRFVCISGWPRYLALYDLAGIGVLDSPFYQQAAWSSFSPWTKRMLGKVRGQYRASGDQIYPGDRLTAEPARMIMIRFRDVADADGESLVSALREGYESRREVLQLRVLRSNYGDRIEYLALVESRIPLLDPRPDPDALGALIERVDLVNEYVPYWRRGPLAGVFTTT
jgi:hypothetical protein